MLGHKEEYLEVKAEYYDSQIEIELNNKKYRVIFPENVWKSLEEPFKRIILDHVAFMSTNYLPLLLDKRGVIYNTRLPIFECFSFKSMLYDLPSSAFLDGKSTVDYLRRYFNLDFVFSSEEPVVWGRRFNPERRAVISFTSGKDSLLTTAVCMELGLEPILVNVVEPSNTYEHQHKLDILRGLNEEFGIQYYVVPHEVGRLHDPKHMGYEESSLGWGNQLFYYMFLHLPFILHHRARYLFYGNEYSCDREMIDPEGFRANFCYDQSSHWTMQMDMALRILTQNSSRVGSLVGPLNEIAIIKLLHQGYPEIAKYQMSCFCDEPVAAEYRWCCNCSKCARNYAFLKAIGVEPKNVGFWRDLFTNESMKLFPVFEGDETYGFDRSGLGREEQEFALHLAYMNSPENEFLKEFSKRSRYNRYEEDCDGEGMELLKRDYEYYFGIHEYPAIPQEIREDVYRLYRRLLNNLT